MEFICSITVTYNADLKIILKQIEELLSQVQKVIIIDNGSQNNDQLNTLIRSNFESYLGNIKIIINEKNMGLGFAQNQGIRYALEQGASDLLFLDHDSSIERNFVRHLKSSRDELMRNNIKVGAIGPIYYNKTTNEQYPITRFHGPFISRLQPSSEPLEATFLISSGMLVNVEIINSIGLMDEMMFVDCIDVQWCFRARAKGYKLFSTPCAKMNHIIGDTRINILGRNISVHSPLRRYYLYRNSIYMVKDKNTPWGYKLREAIFNFFRLIIFFIISNDRIKYLKYSIKGFQDGIKGIYGECLHDF